MKRTACFLYLLSLFLIPLYPVYAQEVEEQAQLFSEETEEGLPRSFRNLSLGMDLESLKNELNADELFNFRGDRDVSLLPVDEQSLIECSGFSFIRRAFFQLKDDRVFIMSFTMDTDRIDHYSVFMQFVGKYGDPASLDPQKAVWISDTTRISLERPLTVKYIDLPVFTEIIGESQTEQSREAELREQFIHEF